MNQSQYSYILLGTLFQLYMTSLISFCYLITFKVNVIRLYIQTILNKLCLIFYDILLHLQQAWGIIQSKWSVKHYMNAAFHSFPATNIRFVSIV